MALNTVSSDRLSTNVKTSNLGTELKKKVGQNKNIIINGAMQVAQRGTSSTSDGYQTVDRFQQADGNIGVTITQSQQSLSSSDTGPYEAGFRKYFRAALASAGTANTNAEVHLYSHLEAQNIANSGWDYTSSTSYITISFWFRCSTNQTFYFYLRTRDGTQQNYPFSFTASANNTWTKVTKTIAGNSNLQFDDDNGSGLSLNWIPFNGTDKTNNKALNQWDAYSGSNVLPDMASTWLTAGASTFDLTGVQLEVGSVATDFEHRSFGQELALCQRYFFRTPAFGTGATSIYLASGVETGTSSRIAFIMPQVMRAAPTVTAGDLNSDDEQSTTDASTVSAIVAGSSNCDRMRIQLTGGSYNAGNAVSLVCANANGFLAGDAEL
jgi:hypothetical protein